MRELFFLKLATIFFKSCAIGYTSSKAIKLDKESICTSSRFDFITDVAARKLNKTGENIGPFNRKWI